ncbi:MAG: 4Fe-4S binding protein [Deltaproteobacteria bacterium]|nr:4Fe-4S binding protein [Deltaproteobacteria bacterium]
MRIATVRRASQVFFLVLFLWFCVVASFGVHWWQLRGWPVSWFLHLDPLVAMGTLLTTGTLYRDLLWALVTVALTVLLGRFFCSWVCPFGSMHHLVGYLGKRGKPHSRKVELNRYHPAQSVKYALLVVLLSAASGAILARFIRDAVRPSLPLIMLFVATVGLAWAVVGRATAKKRGMSAFLGAFIGLWAFIGSIAALDRMITASLQTGLLDPIPLVYRSVNLVLLPLADSTLQVLSVSQRHYEGAWFIGAVFVAAILLNLKVPRFYCRFICPLGALMGILGRYALWRIGRKCAECPQCSLCEADCEGACEPTGTLRLNECVLCMNCLVACRHDQITFSLQPSAGGEISVPDLGRRGLILSMASGIAAVPVLRLEGHMGANWNPRVIRPPGALPEVDFLSRCIKCGQCMRVCPTNIIHPAGLETGLEGVWTPMLNFRLGTSGCQLNCVACGQVCPTAAIRPLTLSEKKGIGSHAGSGPIRLGMAFLDHGRCLPWAMDKPCIVCQENCPVSPKAIFVREVFNTVRGGVVTLGKTEGSTVEVRGASLEAGRYGTGDYYLHVPGAKETTRIRIVANTDRTLSLAPVAPADFLSLVGTQVHIQVRLQRPQVDPDRCIGCGVCEHECPVTGQRAIRVTAENESRSRKRSMLL